MLVVLLLVVMIIVGKLFLVYDWFELDMVGGAIFTISIILLIGILLSIPLTYYETVAEIEQFESVKISIENARMNGSELERVALQDRIMDTNKWIAYNKYWNGTIWNLWIPDKIMELEYIK